jgi:tRNA wybutosine-synthesizing protein 3
MTQKKGFLENKENALQSLKKALNENKADEKILPILKIINDSKEYFTSSSCAGRIVLLEIPVIGDKRQAKFLGIWHRTIKQPELLSAAKKSSKGMIWLLAQSPIIHIAAKTNIAADRLVKIANASGFKNSNLKSVGKKPVVEVCSTERLDSPIGRNSILFCNDEHLKLLIKISNEIMEKSTIKLNRFEQNLKKSLSTDKTTKHIR